VHDDVRLEFLHQVERLANAPEIDEIAGAVTVPPDHVHRAVVGQQLAHLPVHVRDVLAVVADAVIGVMPVARRVIEAEPDDGLVALRDQLISVPAILDMSQWMNIPNRASLHHCNDSGLAFCGVSALATAQPKSRVMSRMCVSLFIIVFSGISASAGG